MCWSLICIPFFLCCLEEYHTDTFYLPYINGVNEGALLIAIILVFTGFVGQDFWDITLGNLNYGQICLYNVYVISTIYWFIR